MSNGSPIPDGFCPDAGLDSEDLVARIVEYDEALAAGRTVEIENDDTVRQLPQETRQRFLGMLDCLEFLDRVRRGPVESPRASASLGDSGSGLQKPIQLKIGRFEVVQELGRGGHGVVFLANDTLLRRQVAIKVPRPEFMLDKEMSRRFLGEAQAAGALDHPNIVKIFDVGLDGAICYIAQEYCTGPSLGQWLLDGRGDAAPTAAAAIVMELARGVDHAHRQGVLHRDLKPSNVLLQPRGFDSRAHGAADQTNPHGERKFRELSEFTPKLGDFGIAKVFEETDDRAQTMTGTILGTAPYMSPEQACGKNSQIGPSSDVYGLGAILYELLSGKPPFDGESRAAIIQHIVSEEPVPPRAVNREIPRDLEAICLKCLEKDTCGRYRTAAELGDDLKRFLAGAPVSARPVTVMRRLLRWSRRRPASAALVLLAALTFVGFALGGWWHSLRLKQEIQSTEKERERADERGREAERQRDAALEREQRLRRDRFCLDSHAAYRAITGGQPTHALELLHPYQGDRSFTTGFVWRYLWRLCHLVEHVWSEPGTDCRSVRFSPDGKRLAAGIGNGTVPIWDVATGKEVMRLRGHTGFVNTVRFTPDGARLATASSDGTARLWNAASGGEERVLMRSTERVLALAISPDGAFLAAGGKARLVTMVRLPGGETIASVPVDYGWVGDLAFSEDGKLLAIVAGDRVNMWRITPRLARHGMASERGPGGGPGPGMRAVGFAPGGSVVAWAGDTGTIHLGDLGLIARTDSSLTGHLGIRTLVFDRGGLRLLCGGETQIVELWDFKARKRIAEFYGNTKLVASVAFSPDERLIASAGFDGTVRLWSTEKSVESLVLPSATGADKMEFALGGSLLIIGGGGKVRAFDTSQWREQFNDDADRFAVSAGPAGDFLATLRNHRQGVVQSIKTRKECGAFKLSVDSISFSLALSADGRHVVSGTVWSLEHWDLLSPGPARHIMNHGDKFHCVSMSPRDPCVVASNSWAIFTVFQAMYAGDRGRPDAHGPTGVVNQVCYNGDGSLFAGASADRSVYVWDAETSKLRASLSGHEEPVNCVAFAPDGKTLASGDDGGVVRLWDLESMHEALRLKAHSMAVKSMAFSPDGRLLATATAHSPEKAGEVRIWFADVPAK